MCVCVFILGIDPDGHLSPRFASIFEFQAPIHVSLQTHFSLCTTFFPNKPCLHPLSDVCFPPPTSKILYLVSLSEFY